MFVVYKRGDNLHISPSLHIIGTDLCTIHFRDTGYLMEEIPDAAKGTIWLNEDRIHYIDAFNAHRALPFVVQDVNNLTELEADSRWTRLKHKIREYTRGKRN